jgi:hypothetical protein
MDQVAKKPLVVRDFTPFHVCALQIAEKAAEIFMARIRHETPGIG